MESSQLEEFNIQTEIQRHLARNRELKELIVSKGAKLDEQRIIELHFWAYGETAARRLGVALEEAGYPSAVSRPSASDPSLWNVESHITSSALAVTTPYFVERLVRIATENEAEFDGWGTSI